jgi:hypothetical protein
MDTAKAAGLDHSSVNGPWPAKPSLAEIFDRVLVFENNRLARDDRHAEVFARVEKAGSAAASD